MKILLQNKNIVLTNNNLISINSNNIAENGNLVKIKQSSEKNDILKINNSLVRVKVTPDPPIVPKGTLINMNLDGTERQYRVLNVNGNVCKVMGMFDDLTSKYNKTNTTITMGTLTVQKYEDSILDTYLNTTWYNTLNNTAKNAIVPENVICDAWYWSDSNASGTPVYNGTYGDAPDIQNYSIGKYISGALNIGNRNVFVLGVQDVIDYLSDESMRVDATAILRSVNIKKMFWNDEVSPSDKTLWLRSSRADERGYVFDVHGFGGFLYSDNMFGSRVVRPAFNIDLSKIEWSIATT